MPNQVLRRLAGVGWASAIEQVQPAFCILGKSDR